MGIKDRFFGRFFQKSTKELDETEKTATVDIQASPVDEKSPEVKKGFLQRMWNKFRKNSYLDETAKIETQTEISGDIKAIDREAEAEPNKETNIKSRLKSIIQNIWRKNSDVQINPPDQSSIEEEEKQKRKSNKLKQLFSQLTQKEKEQNQTEEVIEQVDESLENTSNASKIKNIFHQLVKSANPEDIQKIIEKLPAMNRGPIKEIWPKIQSLLQMTLDPKVAWGPKALAIGSLLYLISPFDAIPDIIPIAGLTDDAALIVSVFSALAFELSRHVKQSADKGVQAAQEIADIEVRKYNRIVRISLTGSIIAAILAIALKLILKNI
ncbi:MAG: YkvA family protein [Cyanobacteria bacterium P01_D01_bin.50]